MRGLALLVIASLLAGCSAQNTSISTLQFSAAANPFPEDYMSRAAAALDRMVAEDAPISISRPQTTLGPTAFAPQRWYVCVRGVPDSAMVRRKPKTPLWDLVEDLADPASVQEELVLIFGSSGEPSIRKSNGSPLCRHAAFEPTRLALMQDR